MFTPIILFPPVVKLLNDGVTFVVGFVRLTVTLHVPTEKLYDFPFRPPEKAHRIALVPCPLLELSVRAEHAVIVKLFGRSDDTLTVMLSVPVIALSSEHPKYTPEIAVICGRAMVGDAMLVALELEYPEYDTVTPPTFMVYVDPWVVPVYTTDVDAPVPGDPDTVIDPDGAPDIGEGTDHDTLPDPWVHPAATRKSVRVPSLLSTNRVADEPTVTVGFGVSYDTALPRETVYPLYFTDTEFDGKVAVTPAGRAVYDTFTIPEPVGGAYDEKVPPFVSDAGKFQEMVEDSVSEVLRVRGGPAFVNSGEKKVALSVLFANEICAGF